MNGTRAFDAPVSLIKPNCLGASPMTTRYFLGLYSKTRGVPRCSRLQRSPEWLTLRTCMGSLTHSGVPRSQENACP